MHIGESDKKAFQELTELLDHIRAEYRAKTSTHALEVMSWNYTGVDLYKRLVSGLTE